MSRILVVEDHPKLLRSLRRGLSLLGYEVLVTETGADGFAKALAGDIDLLVLDVMLPDRNGFDVLKELRIAGFGRPALILTAKDSPDDRRRARECGANAFLAKPFAFAALVSDLEHLLQRRPSPGANELP